nr:FBD-associated F-box protein At1g66320-like [Setaria viridis]
MAPLTRQRKKALAAAAGPSIAPADRLGALPDDALRRILGFLPAKDVVRTCVLGRHCRHLWKSASGLRIGSAEEPAACGDKLMEFVGSLLQARGGSPLETCELLLCDYDNEDEPNINRWIRCAVMCHVRVLFLGFSRTLHWFEVVSLPLVSQHLARLVLFILELNGNFLDFSSCSVLEQLEIDHCRLQSVNRISSQSLKNSFPKPYFAAHGMHYGQGSCS